MAAIEQNEAIQQEEGIDVMEYASILWCNKILILLVAVAFALGSYILTDYRFHPTYSSTTQIYILEKNPKNNSSNSSDLSLGLEIAPDCIELVRCRPVIERAIILLGNSDYSYEYVRGCVNVENPENTRILRISATTSDPESAQSIANAVRASASDYICDIMDIQAVNLIEEATFPTSPTSSGAKNSALYGFLGGALLCCIIIVVRHRMDDTIKTPEDVSRYLELSILGTLPFVDKNARGKKSKNGKGAKQ